MPIEFLTAGESHGRALSGILQGIPAGLALKQDDVNADLKRRQGGYGRGGRMKIESDAVQFISGVRWGQTLGSPISLMIENRDWKNWSEGMSASEEHKGSIDAVTRPRPGHADLPGVQKFGHSDVRAVLERSSARETAMRVAVGAVCRQMLLNFDITIGSYITSIGSEVADVKTSPSEQELLAIQSSAEGTELRCPDDAATGRMKTLIDDATKNGDSLGGTYTVFATGLPPGLGSHVQWNLKLDGKLAQALMSIQAMKGVEIGMGFGAAASFGSEVMDEIEQGGEGLLAGRATNNAGGIEGGISNGMPVMLRVAMKPIPTLRRPLKSINIDTKETVEAAYERSDVCAAPAAAVVGEAMVAIVLADAMLEKFGGDSMTEIKRNYSSYMDELRAR